MSSKYCSSSRVASERGRGRSTPMILVIRPGRALMTTIREERKTASGIEWVTNTIVVPVCSQMRSSSVFIRSRVISSSAPNGSSISSRRGSKASARAIAARCCMPPESCHGWWRAKSLSSTSASISAIRPERCARGLRPWRTVAQDDELRDADEPEEGDPDSRADEGGRPQLLGPRGELLVELDDGSAEPTGDARRRLGHDGADDAGGGADLQR